jgi:DNA-binding NarL/FixJ family response regulator
LLGGKGLDLLKMIKTRFPSTIVIVFTNHVESMYRDIYLKEGADYFLDKSVEFEKIIDVCNSLLQIH